MMTREEAIWYLTPIAESASLERYKEALSMAVAALGGQEERRWIPVKERIPENGQKVIFYNYGADAVYAGKFNYIGKNGTVWFRVGKTSYPGSYWMPLPEAPKEDAT